MVIPLEFRNAD